MRRREFITLAGGAAATWPLAVRALQPERVRRIGVLLVTIEGDQALTATFVRGLQKFGWTAGTNVMIDYRWEVATSTEFGFTRPNSRACSQM
jgi:putative ABC transport system substrate-binding protein